MIIDIQEVISVLVRADVGARGARVRADIKPLLDANGFLSAEDKANIFAENARRLFPRLKIERAG
jgi:hypothetical protein